MLTPFCFPEDVVYLKTDPDFLPRICTAYKVSKEHISYELVCGTCVSYHYEYELTKDRDFHTSKNKVGLGN